MSTQKLARGMVEIPRGVSTSQNENSQFVNILERTNNLLAQFLSSPEESRMLLRTDLEEAYFNVTLYNLKDSIKHKIEQDMWNNLFKKHVSDLQGKMKSKDKIEVAKAQSELSLFLDEAMGYYSKYLDVLSLIHNIRLPGKQMTGIKSLPNKYAGSSEVSDDDLCYIVQHCFVHLGDLSRYHNLHKLARLNYQYAVELNPHSGHAYNQLAILESSSVSQTLGHNNYTRLLHTILFYDYANTCRSPFPAARINLDSMLRHIHQESVSELLTSNTAIEAHNCLSSLAVAWLHAYAAARLRNNVHRCRQLQQRIIEWMTDLGRHYHQQTLSHWRDLCTIVALQCALLSASESAPETAESASWNINLQQFTQDFINSTSHGLMSISHDVAVLDSLLIKPSCVSVIVVFLAWISQFLTTVDGEISTKNRLHLTAPFGEQFVRFLNLLCVQQNQILSIDTLSAPITLPTNLPELQFLSGYQPLNIPCKKYNLFLVDETPENPLTDIDAANIRRSFIISVSLKLANQQCSLLVYDIETGQFVNVPPVVEPALPKKPPKIEPLVANKKYINVALASIKNNNLDSNGMDKRKNVPSKMPLTTMTSTHVLEPVTTIVTDVKIAQYIQEHIALATTTATTTTINHRQDPSSLISMTSPIRDDYHGMAPAPGLILSSNLPPEYKSMSLTTSTTATASETELDHHHHHHHRLMATSPDNNTDNFDPNKSSTVNNKNHSYNPNREQFEKDLPPRFANKRTTAQKENKTGFKSLNYWDSTNPYPSISNNCDTNLTMKESEMLVPPTVPPSWLTEEHQDRVSRHTMDANMNMSPLQFQMTSDALNQQHTSFNNALQQNSLNMFQPSFNQFQKHSMSTDQDNNMKQYLQTSSANPNNFSYQISPDLMDHSHLKYDNVFMPSQTTAHGMTHNYPPIPPPPPPPSSSSSSSTSHAVPSSTHCHGSQLTQNFEQYSMARQNCYDKPIFSSSNQSGYGVGYTSSSLMAQQQHNQQQQQQQQHQQMQQHNHNHQMRANNPLLNLLPGFINEMQR